MRPLDESVARSAKFPASPFTSLRSDYLPPSIRAQRLFLLAPEWDSGAGRARIWGWSAREARRGGGSYSAITARMCGAERAAA